MVLLIRAVNWFAEVLMLLLLARAICSWFVRPGSSAYRLYQVFVTLTEPVVAPCRIITSKFRTGMMDFSVLLAMLLVMVARDLLVRILAAFVF